MHNLVLACPVPLATLLPTSPSTHAAHARDHHPRRHHPSLLPSFLLTHPIVRCLQVPLARPVPSDTLIMAAGGVVEVSTG